MFKKIKDKMNNKKGFTLVELIVVIVIILILAAVLVPNVMKYISKASQANCKQDAASILTQVQAEVADKQADCIAKNKPFEAPTFTVGKVNVSTSGNVDATHAVYVCGLNADTNELEITQFDYSNGNYTISWNTSGWGDPTPVTAKP